MGNRIPGVSGHFMKRPTPETLPATKAFEAAIRRFLDWHASDLIYPGEPFQFKVRLDVDFGNGRSFSVEEEAGHSPPSSP